MLKIFTEAKSVQKSLSGAYYSGTGSAVKLSREIRVRVAYACAAQCGNIVFCPFGYVSVNRTFIAVGLKPDYTVENDRSFLYGYIPVRLEI